MEIQLLKKLFVGMNGNNVINSEIYKHTCSSVRSFSFRRYFLKKCFVNMYITKINALNKNRKPIIPVSASTCR